MNISVVIPLLNEKESLRELTDSLIDVMKSYNFSYEIIFIDDGSSDNSWDIIEELSSKSDTIKGIKFHRNYGKSQALHAGFLKSQGKVVFTMDADLQDDPKEIPAMYDMIMNDNFDLVSGWKKKRFDSVIFKNIPSKIFNFAARTTSGIKLNDFNCGLKAFKKDVIKSINVYGEMHRYIPILAKNEGYKKIGEKIVNHRPRKYGKTKFGPSRFLYGFLDLLTIWFISSFGKRPMHLFGSLGLILITTGFLFAAYLGYDKIILNPGGRLITERPEFYISLVTMIIGSQFFSMGFIGELMLKSINQKPQYIIQKQTNL
jgi:glycosyltransferase involved in cell wall biosynthesis|tara:strand:- start:1294 stop:2241 length:948 start_codon:yes stop_codon:yes gene_type:complete